MDSFVWFILGLILGLVIVLVAVFNEPTKEQIGYNQKQLMEMKKECEKDLPRTTECSIVVYYLPEAELKEK